MRFFDAHTHVQFAAYDADRKEVMERALKAGVSMLNVGTQANTSAAAVRLAHEFENLSPRHPFHHSREWWNEDDAQQDSARINANAGVYASVGLHPIHTGKAYHDEQELSESDQRPETRDGEIFDYDYYRKLALDPKVVAIGECGLDYYRVTSDQRDQRSATRKKQKDVFIKQIELSKEVNKPLMIHCRNAFTDLIDILVSCRRSLVTNPGVVHFFSGTIDDAEKLLELGFSFTFGGVITFPPKADKSAGDYDGVIKFIPLDRILSETDAPYVTPVPYRGKRNEPAYVVEVVKKLAEIKSIPVEEMAEKISENAKRVFKI